MTRRRAIRAAWNWSEPQLPWRERRAALIAELSKGRYVRFYPPKGRCSIAKRRYKDLRRMIAEGDVVAYTQVHFSHTRRTYVRLTNPPVAPTPPEPRVPYANRNADIANFKIINGTSHEPTNQR